MSRQSPEAAQALADAVQKKLAAKNPVVKFKVRVEQRSGAHGSLQRLLLPAF
jgi:hypothetical protein